MKHHSRILTLLLLIVACSAPAKAQRVIDYRHVEVADGVHAFIPSEPGLGTVTAVVSRGDALVVDATGTPDAALDVLEHLRALGTRRVSTLVNTHWHDDHLWGSQSFAEAFPGLTIVAHPATVVGIRDQAIPALDGQIDRLRQRVAERSRLLESGRDADGAELTAVRRAALEARQAFFREAIDSLETVTPTLTDSPRINCWLGI